MIISNITNKQLAELVIRVVFAMCDQLTIEADGAARGNGSGPASAAFVVYKNGEIIAKRGKFLGNEGITNNVAEYYALIFALEYLAENQIKSVTSIKMDSQLVVSQVTGKWKINNARLLELSTEVKRLMDNLSPVSISWIPREQNKAADQYANELLEAEKMKV